MLSRIAVLGLTACLVFGLAQQERWNEQQIKDKIGSLRELPVAERSGVTKAIALAIREVPSAASRLSLATTLSNLATEGDPGHETLQAVADTLAAAVRAGGAAEGSYQALARLARYEGVSVELQDAGYRAAMDAFAAMDRKRESATFSLTDLDGKQWSLAALRGKVVLVNFWATWCPPCRKEMPDMDALYVRFRDRGLVVLAISDEDEALVRKYLGENPYHFPVLLDRERKANEAYVVEGIPKSFVYDREGKIVAMAMDQRTERQFLEMLGKAGLR